MKSNYWVMLLCLLASGFIGCSDDDGDNWKKTFEDEQARIKDFVYRRIPIRRFSSIIILI